MTDRDTEIADLRDLFDVAWCDPMHPDFDPHNDLWQGLPEDVRGAFYVKRQRLAVLERGFTIQGVFPTEPGGYHFYYTIGDDPSIIITGNVTNYIQAVIALARATAADHPDGEAWAPDPDDPDNLFVFAPVPDDQFREHCTGAIREGATHARQFLWTDDEHRWPWHPDHRCHQAGYDPMPVLAGPDWRPR